MAGTAEVFDEREKAVGTGAVGAGEESDSGMYQTSPDIW